MSILRTLQIRLPQSTIAHLLLRPSSCCHWKAGTASGDLRHSVAYPGLLRDKRAGAISDRGAEGIELGNRHAALRTVRIVPCDGDYEAAARHMVERWRGGELAPVACACNRIAVGKSKRPIDRLAIVFVAAAAAKHGRMDGGAVTRQIVQMVPAFAIMSAKRPGFTGKPLRIGLTTGQGRGEKGGRIERHKEFVSQGFSRD